MAELNDVKERDSVKAPDTGSNALLEDSGFVLGKDQSRVSKSLSSGDVIPDQYIVVLKEKPLGSHAAVPGSADKVDALMSKVGLSSTGPDIHTYRNAFSGFAAKLDANQLAALKKDPEVAMIEQDRMVSIDPLSVGQASDVVANELPRGVDRIDGELSKTAQAAGGVNVDVAVIDTGINLKHSDLNVVSNVSFVKTAGNGEDDNGHGSHVAGTIAARSDGKGVKGVAPGARLWAVKVLNAEGSGQLSDVAAGLDYVTKNADKIEVANMSLGGKFKSDVIDKALSTAVDAGVSIIVAAGNSNDDTSKYSPANHPQVLAVSAVCDSDGKGGGLGGVLRGNPDDSLASFSNYGEKAKIAAPGVAIESCWMADGIEPDEYNTISGTSMAAPHVAGAAALIKSNFPNMKPADVYKKILDGAKPQIDPNFGFKGDRDKFAEPMLYVGGF